MAAPQVKNLLKKVQARAATAPANTPAPVETKTNFGAQRRTPAVSDIFGSQGPHVTTGELGDSRGYSCQKALMLARNPGTASNAKLEVHVSDLLDAVYAKNWQDRNPNGVLMPLGMELMPDEIQSEPKYQEIKSLVLAGAKAADPEEVQWLKKAFYGTKAQSWIDTFAGGSLVGAPVQGELIDLLRNKLAFGNATISSMPPTGVRFPRWLHDPVGTWASENEQVDPANAQTGVTTFLPKKLLCLANFPNELIAYGSPSVDAMFRNALMQSVALSMDAGFLRGNGSDEQPMGIQTMAAQQIAGTKDWGINIVYIGSDQELAHAPADLMDFPSTIESANGEMTQWIGRPDLFWSILKQRFSTIAANDGQGGFLYDFARAAKDGFPNQLLGIPFNKTNQIIGYAEANPTVGDGTYSDLIGLDIKDFWIGMLGAVEVLSSTEENLSFRKDQTTLRAKVIGNGGPKHPGLVAISQNVKY